MPKPAQDAPGSAEGREVAAVRTGRVAGPEDAQGLAGAYTTEGIQGADRFAGITRINPFDVTLKIGYRF